MRLALVCIPGELGNLCRQALLHTELLMDAYWMSCCIWVSILADKQAYSVIPEYHQRTAKYIKCEPVERSNRAYWQLVTNPYTAPDSTTFVLSMNKNLLFFYCNTNAKNN